MRKSELGRRKTEILEHKKLAGIRRSTQRLIKTAAYSCVPAALLSMAYVASGAYEDRRLLTPISLVLPALIFTLPVIACYYFYYFAIFKKSRVPTVIASLFCSAFFFSYEQRLDWFYNSIRALTPLHREDERLYSLFFLLGCVLFFGLLAKWLLQAVRFLKLNEQRVFQLLIIIIFGYSSFHLVKSGHFYWQMRHQLSYRPAPVSLNNAVNKGDHPDIYYLILDRYASNDVLNTEYGFDNSSFLNKLRSRGFSVYDHATSNYPLTAPSVASTMSSDYLSDIQANYGRDSFQSQFPLYNTLDASLAAQIFKKIGYKYYHFGSWWGPTRISNQADNNYNDLFTLVVFNKRLVMTEYESEQLESSFLWRFIRQGTSIGPLTVLKGNELDYRALFDYQMGEIAALAGQPEQGNRFIFGHILSPHDPYVYNEDGSVPSYPQGSDDIGLPVKQKYLNQLKYLNTRVEELISSILSTAKRPPIIIIQSDEGPYPRTFFDVGELSEAELRQKYGILAAYYLPGVSSEKLASFRGSVNTFRLVLNEYFGQRFPYLPNCSFAFKTRDRYLDFYDITRVIRPNDDNSKCDQFLRPK